MIEITRSRPLASEETERFLELVPGVEKAKWRYLLPAVRHL